MKHEFIIGEYAVDLPESFKLEMVVQNNLFDPDNVFLDSSIFFEVAATAPMQKALKHANRLQAPFDMEMVQAIYKHGGVQHFTGMLVIQKFSKKIYKMAYFSNGVSLEIGAKTLREIPWPDLLRANYSDPTLWTFNQFEPGNSPISFPTFRGNKMYSDDHQALNPTKIFNRMKPSTGKWVTDTVYCPWVYFEYVVKTFMAYFGCKVEGDFFEVAVGRRLSYPTNYLIDANASVKGKVDADITETAGQTQWDNQKLIFNQEYIDNYNVHDNAGGDITFLYAGNWTVQMTNLHVEIKRDPNPLFGEEVYTLEVFLMVKGVQVASTNTLVGLMTNGNSIENRFINLGPVTFDVTNDDIGKTAAVFMRFNATNTRVSARIRSGKITADFAPMQNASTYIPFKELVPNMKFSDFLVVLQKMHPLMVRFNPANKILRIDLAPRLKELNLPHEDWTRYAGETSEAEPNRKGYTLNYNYSQEAIDKLIPLDQLVFKGYTLSYVSAHNLRPTSPKDYLYSSLTNEIFKAKVTNFFGSLRYEPYSESVYPIVLGDGETKIIPETRPVSMVYFPSWVIPDIPFEGNSEFFKEGSSDFELLVAFYHGSHPAYDNAPSGAGVLPYASPSNLNLFGQVIGIYSLHYQDQMQGLYKYWYEQFLTALLSALTVEMNLLLPKNEILNLNLAKYKVIDHVLYILRTLVYSLGDMDISEATATLVKIDPLARVLATPPEVVKEFNCEMVVLEDGQPADGQFEFGDTLTVNYTISNLTSTQVISGIATIAISFIDSAGNKQLLEERPVSRTLQPGESQTISQSFVINDTNYPALREKYTGKIVVDARFGDRCSKSLTYDYLEIPPQINVAFEWERREFADDVQIGKHMNRFKPSFISSKPFTSWKITLQFKVNGVTQATMLFNQNDYRNPYDVTVLAGVNYNTEIKPYFTIYMDPTGPDSYLRFFKVDYSLFKGWYNDGTTDNSRTYTLSMKFEAQGQTLGFFDVVCPKDVFVRDYVSSMFMQVTADNTVAILSNASTMGYPATSGVTNVQICHEGLVFGTYNKALPFVCATGNGNNNSYVHNPTNAVVGANPNYLLKQKINGVGGIVGLQYAPVQEITGGLNFFQHDFNFRHTYVAQQFDIAYRANSGQPNKFLIQANSYSLTVKRGAAINDANSNVAGYYTVTGGTVVRTIPAASWTVHPARYAASAQDSFVETLPGKYTVEAVVSLDELQVKYLREMILWQT